MKNIKSVLALVLAVCLMMSLAVTAFAEEVTVLSAPAETTAATTEATEATTEATEAATEAATEPEETVDEHAGHDHSTETTGTTETKEVSPAWKAVRIVLTVLEVLASLAMVLVILFQSGKESGLSGAIAGGNDTYASKHGKLDKKLAKATKWCAVAWLVLTLVLSLLP